MKKIISIFILVFSLTAITETPSAQGKGNGKGNGNGKAKKNEVVVAGPEKKHGPPPWAPANGYRKRHLYFPDYKCYYDNTKGVYIYMNNNVWTTSVEIPLSLKNVDLKVAVKIELDLDDLDSPQIQFDTHLKLYPAKK